MRTRLQERPSTQVLPTTTKETPQNIDQEQQLQLLVVAGDGPSLWGRDWLSAIQLNIKQVSARLGPLVQKYSEVFQEELGTLKGIEAK